MKSALARSCRNNPEGGTLHQCARNRGFIHGGGVYLGSDSRGRPKQSCVLFAQQAHIVRDQQHAARRGHGPRKCVALIRRKPRFLRAQHYAIRIVQPQPAMHETSRYDRVDCVCRARLDPRCCSPVRRNVRTDSHPVDDSDPRSEWTTASEDESLFAGSAANSFEPPPQCLGTRETGIVAYPFGRRRKEEIQLQVIVTEIVDEGFEQPFEMLCERRVAGVERVRELVFVRGPVGIETGGKRSATFIPYEPVRMFAHEPRIARSEKRRRPQACRESCVTNLAGDPSESAWKFGVCPIPIAERGLVAVVELHDLDRILRSHLF